MVEEYKSMGRKIDLDSPYSYHMEKGLYLFCDSKEEMNLAICMFSTLVPYVFLEKRFGLKSTVCDQGAQIALIYLINITFK